jgi:hypothetical protein
MIKEVTMLKERKDFLKKSLAILGCAAFISMSFSGVAQAATKSSSKEFRNPEKLFSLISPFLCLVGHDFSLGLYDSATAYCLLDKDKNPPPKTEEKGTTEETGKQKQENKDSYYDKSGNSTSKKKPRGKD